MKNLQSQTKIVGTLKANTVFSLSNFPFPSQCCLLRFSHQNVYTNIERMKRHRSFPTVLTETVACVEGLNVINGPKCNNNLP